MCVRLTFRYHLVSLVCFVLVYFSSFRRSFSNLPAPRPRSLVRNHLLFTLLPCSRAAAAAAAFTSFMSQCQSLSQPWPLSQKANKQSGICSVCFATRQIHIKDGTIHLHGPRLNPCPGSHKPPLGNLPAVGGSTDTQNQKATPAVAIADTVPATNSVAGAPPSHSISHPMPGVPLIKHIPRSARPHIARELTSVLNCITSNPDDPTNWSSLLSFGPNMLHAPPRTGRRHNLASTLMKRTACSTHSLSDHQPAYRQRQQKSSDQLLASAVTAKIEDGNIKAAIRIVTSGEQPASDDAHTLHALHERHPCAASDRQPFQAPSELLAANFIDEDIIAAIHSFPAGSSGGPDGIRPQHLRDLTSNKETGALLIASLTAFVNCLMDGRCPLTVAPIFLAADSLLFRKSLVASAP